MKQNIFRILRLYGCVLLTFLLIQKPLFMLFNLGHGASEIGFSDLLDIYYHGLSLDLATTGYLSALAILFIILGHAFPRLNMTIPLKIWCGIIAFLISIAAVVDASLYEYWEFKLDNTVFMYIGDPKNAFASVSVWYVVWRTGLICLLTYLLYKVYVWACVPRKKDENTSTSKKSILDRWYAAIVVYLLIIALVFAGIRGIDIWPNTPSKGFYSKTAFFNHTAVNPIFNVIYSLSHRGNFRKEFRFYEDEEVDKTVKPLFPTEGKAEKVLTTDRPNILYIIIEGMGSIFIDELHNPDSNTAAETGELPKDVAPRLSKLMKEGICFDQCYCGSFRTDRGSVCALSGYLGQPTTSIMRYSRKVASLPGLPKSLKQYGGYETQILYASDITFFNMSDYFLAAGHDKLVSQDDFPADQRTAKWGVHDHLACQWLLDDIKKRGNSAKPWYTTFLTISSHTPFDVPYHKLKDEKLNSFAYADESIGNLIDSLKALPVWDNLLVVITADHGFNHREIASANFPLIPFLMTGGAVKENRRIHTFVSQTDIPATILGQLDMPHTDFPFSRDVLADTYTYPFAFNTFNSGFNLRDSTGITIYDHDAQKVTLGPDARREKIGKSILQYLYNDLDAR